MLYLILPQILFGLLIIFDLIHRKRTSYFKGYFEFIATCSLVFILLSNKQSGTDISSYQDIYDNSKYIEDWGVEIGYHFINYIFTDLISFNLFKGFFCVVIYSFIYILLKRNLAGYRIAFSYIVIVTLIPLAMGAIRQLACVFFTMLAFFLIIEKKYYRASLITTLSISFHAASFFTLLYIKLNNKNVKLISKFLITLAAIIFLITLNSNPLFDHVLTKFIIYSDRENDFPLFSFIYKFFFVFIFYLVIWKHSPSSSILLCYRNYLITIFISLLLSIFISPFFWSRLIVFAVPFESLLFAHIIMTNKKSFATIIALLIIVLNIIKTIAYIEQYADEFLPFQMN